MPHKGLGFYAKVAAAAGLTAVGDVMLYAHVKGLGLGLFCLAWVGVALGFNPQIRRSRSAMTALAAAALLGLSQIEAAGPLGVMLFWTALSGAVLLSRTGRFDDAWRWLQRGLFHLVRGLASPLLDAIKLQWVCARGRRRRAGAPRPNAFAVWALPVLGGLIFLGLFVSANPVLGDVLSHLQPPALEEGFLFRVIFWLLIAGAVWMTLRPRLARRIAGLPMTGERTLPGVSPQSVTLSLIVFNLLFAVQNGMDIAFLWTGARLPEAYTLAEYIHRGFFPLMVTALLAGVFVLVALSPSAQTSRIPAVRWLVLGWVAQNLLLVGFCIQRMMLYVESYSLTPLRIVVMAWMALVAVGLALICWRMFAGRSSAWLINANALAAAVVLAGFSIADLAGIAAQWNVTHAREVGGRGVELDVCYLRDLGPSALVPLARLEQRPLPPILHGAVTSIRAELQADVQRRQADWRGWTWRNARRLADPAVRAAPAYGPREYCSRG